MALKQRKHALLLAIVLLASCFDPTIEAAGRSGGFGGGSRTSFSAPSRPSSSYSAPAPTRSGGFGATSFNGYRYSRRGSLTSPILIGFAAGYLTSSALNSLNSNPNAYCNGVSIVCYKQSCQNALAQCGASNSTQLNLIPCPDNRFGECYQTPDTFFQCYGTRRPRFGNEDVQGFCDYPDNSAGGLKVHMVLMSVLVLVAVLLL